MPILKIKTRHFLFPFLMIALFSAAIALGSMGIEASIAEAPEMPASDAQAIGQLNGGSQHVYLPIAIHDNLRPMNVFGVASYLPANDALGRVIETDTYWVHGIWAHWASIEPVKGGGYQWSAMSGEEEKLKIAALNELTPIVTIRLAPSWARQLPAYNCSEILTSELDEFAAFVSALVTRYSAPPYNVKYWEIWNEPDIAPHEAPPEGWIGCWGDDGDDVGYGGDDFADMLKQVYPAIKAADPSAQVLVGGLLLDCNPDEFEPGCEPSYFLNGILANGGGPYFDGVAFHSYDYYGGEDTLGVYRNANWVSGWNTTGPVIKAKADFLRTLLSNHAVTGKYLMNLESAVLCGFWATCDSDFETTKAYYLAHAYAMTIGEDLLGGGWYGMEVDFIADGGSRNSALLDDDLSPLPAYYTYQFASGFLNGATSDQEVTAYPGVMGYDFDRSGTEVWVIWSKDGSSHFITLPGTPSAMYEIGSDGKPNSLTPNASVTVTLAPIFIEY